MASPALMASFNTVRYDRLVKAFTTLFASHPDVAVFTPEYRTVLVRAYAAKLVYGVTYEDDVEGLLTRLSRSRGITLAR